MQREDYPRPDAVRPRLRILDGEWSFAADPAAVTDAINVPSNAVTVRVPYAPGTNLSGVKDVPLSREWRYYRKFALSPFECAGSVILNFNNIDGYFEIFLNGSPVGAGTGAFASSHFDVSALCKPGENILCVIVRAVKEEVLRGIWGEVWLEFAARSYFAFVRATIVYADKKLYVQGNLAGNPEGLKIRTEVAFRGKQIASYDYKASANFTLCAPLDRDIEPWQIGAPELYDVRLTLYNAKGGICDTLYTYTAFREIKLFENKLYVNGRKTFLRAINDGCVYHGAGNTAPSSAIIAQDYATALTLGFNAVQFDSTYPSPRHLYIMDKLGLAARVALVGSSDPHPTEREAAAATEENVKLIARDYGHPSILFWLPFIDFSGPPQLQITGAESYKKLDSTRIIPATSGGKIYMKDLYDFRLNEPDCEALKALLYIRTNGGIYGEKEEARMLKADGALLPSAALRKLAAYVGSFTAGRVTKNDYLSEKSFIDTYASAYDLIAASGAIGFTLSDLVDTGKGGILDAERNFLLSREGLTKLIAVNKKKAFAES